MGHGFSQDLHNRVEEALHAGICAVPQSRSEAKRFRRALRAGVVMSPYQNLYVDPGEWKELKKGQKERIIIKSLALAHPKWTFAGTSAAIVHGLEVPYSLMGTVHLATQRPTHIRNHKGFV